MKIKIFVISLIAGLVMTIASTATVFFASQTTRAQLKLDGLTDGLYQANAELVRWAMSDLDAAKLATVTLPPELAEVALIEPASLRITAATVNSHRGLLLPQVPGLLDHAEPLIQALGSGKPAVVTTRDYTIITRPAEGGLQLVAFKPRAAEAALLANQQAAIAEHFQKLKLILLATAGGGLVLALIMAFGIAQLASGSHSQALMAFDALSRGDFESAPAGLKPDEQRIYARLHASLSLALDRLSRR